MIYYCIYRLHNFYGMVVLNVVLSSLPKFSCILVLTNSSHPSTLSTLLIQNFEDEILVSWVGCKTPIFLINFLLLFY
ncbi:hypothetical protein M6B38_275545 [Iris pallida]|uniref:Uncharacterized protein n=1 Tax=Iris pallida TaxID=29817 RepID=A0AAX6I602_IRIPA|nr:hypothetical protein M6B38_275545 [Iris pallida]